MTRILLIHNPASGSSDEVDVETLVRDAVAANDTIDCVSVGDIPAATELLSAGTLPDRVIVAGGDGSIGVAAALAADLHVPFGVIATGTANDFAGAMNLPQDIGDAVRVATQNTSLRLIDLCWIHDIPFVNVASAGLAPRASREAARMKRWLGAPAYAVGALRAAIGAKPITIGVDIQDGPTFDGAAWQVMVSGTGAFGGGAATGGVRVDDGNLGVTLIPHGRGLQAIPDAWALLRRRLASRPDVMHASGRQVRLRCPVHMQLVVDGELVRPSELNLTCRVDAGCLQLVVAESAG